MVLTALMLASTFPSAWCQIVAPEEEVMGSPLSPSPPPTPKSPSPPPAPPLPPSPMPPPHPSLFCDCLKSMVVFGTTYSDAGLPNGLWSYTNKTDPPLGMGYFDGRCTNGPGVCERAAMLQKPPRDR
jgi:hypothetical protein